MQLPLDHVLCLPDTCVPAERAFSQIKQRRRRAKSRMNVSTLVSLLRIKVSLEERCLEFQAKQENCERVLTKTHSSEKYQWRWAKEEEREDEKEKEQQEENESNGDESVVVLCFKEELLLVFSIQKCPFLFPSISTVSVSHFLKACLEFLFEKYCHSVQKMFILQIIFSSVSFDS